MKKLILLCSIALFTISCACSGEQCNKKKSDAKCCTEECTKGCAEGCTTCCTEECAEGCTKCCTKKCTKECCTKDKTCEKGMAGGFSEQMNITNADKMVFEEAMMSNIEADKFTPKTVARQVVAGMNYLFICDIVGINGEVFEEEVLIFDPLPNTNKPPTVIRVGKKK